MSHFIFITISVLAFLFFIVDFFATHNFWSKWYDRGILISKRILADDEIDFESPRDQELETAYAKIKTESKEVIRFRKKTVWIGRNSMQLFRGTIKRVEGKITLEYRLSYGFITFFSFGIIVVLFQTLGFYFTEGAWQKPHNYVFIPIVFIVAAINFFIMKYQFRKVINDVLYRLRMF